MSILYLLARPLYQVPKRKRRLQKVAAAVRGTLSADSLVVAQTLCSHKRVTLRFLNPVGLAAGAPRADEDSGEGDGR